MNQQTVVEKTVIYVKKTLQQQEGSHDWFHIERVWKNAVKIGLAEQADMFVVELAALLHDIADHKFHGGDETMGPRVAREWLTELGVDREVVQHVSQIIADLSFKGAHTQTVMKTKEGMVVQDADRLDAIGAIGIARAFAYGGYKGQALYDPEIPPTLHASFAEYKQAKSTSVNHFYEKLLLLKDRMNTEAGRKMAAERHAFMEQFLERLQAECGVTFERPER
ncbi:HD domain-containing protein [Laceyella putida]|uniref:HD domain-containing protein n=1 Tax=Laceyella putida TaxID=110101 RepID=A0ABW2RGX0_9BACL